MMKTSYEELLTEVKTYINEVKRYDYNDEFTEFVFSRGKKNYDNIFKTLLNLPTIYENTPFKTYDETALNEIVLIIMSDILGNEYQAKIKEYLKISVNSRSAHSFGSYFEVYQQDGQEIAKKFRIANRNTGAGAVAMGHEYTHGILLPKNGINFNSYYGNIHYKELPSMMMERIVATKFDALTSDVVTPIMTLLRQESSAEQARQIVHFEGEADLYRTESAEQLAVYQLHKGYGYIVCNIYTTYLHELYLNDPLHFLKLFRSLIKGEINLPEYFKKYGLGLNNNEIKDLYLKGLKR